MHNTHISAIKVTYTESFYVDSSQIFHPKKKKKSWKLLYIVVNAGRKSLYWILLVITFNFFFSCLKFA